MKIVYFGLILILSIKCQAQENATSFLQHQFSEDEKFFCDTHIGKSKKVPSSVHKLKPGDIDIVAAIGDSLTGFFIDDTRFFSEIISFQI